MPSRARTTLALMIIAALLLIVALCLSGRPSEGRPSSYPLTAGPRTTVTPRTSPPSPAVPVAVDTLASARARRDAALFTAWVSAVAARPLPALEHPCPDDVERIIRDVFAGTGEEDYFVGIAWRESRCQPGATNPNGGQVDSGVMQIRMPLHANLVGGCDIFEARCNVEAARRMYDICGVGPWDKAGGYWCEAP